jgi:hypothetical protein
VRRSKRKAFSVHDWQGRKCLEGGGRRGGEKEKNTPTDKGFFLLKML